MNEIRLSRKIRKCSNAVSWSVCTKQAKVRAAAKAMWIQLRLPSFGPRFESQEQSLLWQKITFGQIFSVVNGKY